MDKKAVVHIHNGILLGSKKNNNNNNKEMLPFVRAWIGLEIIALTEISQSEKDKYHRISLTCGIQ